MSRVRRPLRVVFLERLPMEKLGIMYLISATRRAGHLPMLFLEGAERDLLGRVEEARPDLVAFSVTTGMHRWALETARRIKKRMDTRVIFGGPHASYTPSVLDHDGVDMICRGEGEEALVELLERLEAGAEPTDVANLWVKGPDGEVHRNDVRPLVEDLDGIAFPDRDLYYRYPYLRRMRSKPLLTGRGCSFQCSFCHNHLDMRMYSGKGKWVRKRSPENVVEEIRDLMARYPVSVMNLERDDHMTINRHWTRSFLEAYAREVPIPFVMQCRPETIDREVADLLAEARCEAVTISFETANERLRNELLRKEIADEEVIQAVHLLKDRGIFVKTLNMIGIPGESIEDAFETARFNARLRPHFARCSITTPYPSTELFAQAAREGLVPEGHGDDDYFEDYFQSSVIEHPDRARMENLHKFFTVLVAAPWLEPLVRLAIRVPPNTLYYRLYLAVFVLFASRFAGMTPRNVFDLVRFSARPLPHPQRSRRERRGMLAVLHRLSFNFD